MGIAEYSDAIRPKGQHFIHGAREAIGGLVRQAVTQVDIDALETKRARAGHQLRGHLEGLHAPYGSLHFGIKVLDAHAQAIKAEAAERLEMIRTGDSRIDFDPDFRIGSKRESLRSETEQIFHLRGRQVSGRSAAPMELYNRARMGNLLADVLNLPF